MEIKKQIEDTMNAAMVNAMRLMEAADQAADNDAVYNIARLCVQVSDLCAQALEDMARVN